ncbi:TetR/AcrR family transcriptional regulator [Tsukamurella paurometabola]|uniref:HTH-type transcriptional repressor KstR2 n=2 Tax=Tsukamurella paurometabola TaxID=2061 RepID=A0A3P8KVT6_TSUPA|nr:TetR/AcrR family transcriptional regulator [Tsukamurella paurometabola]UEA84205.1 TetR/AcrR family transcriptional regulator [Tsukamurella paurometabola]VDR41377.1 HTH-type transcriptional repressor KstR2 [Tsukamurella paurometabola]
MTEANGGAGGGAETAGKRGRPRVNDPRRPGATAVDEILDAAAELFTQRGYAATSTRQIAEAVGMRQASLYHYFPTKGEILTALLEATVQAPLALARSVVSADGSPLDRLLTLARSDAGQLLAARYNLGALYHLPELAAEEFSEFRADRSELASHYRSLATAVVGDDSDPRTFLPFRLVESVIGLRSDGAVGAGSGAGDGASVDGGDVVDVICRAIQQVLA